MVMNSSLTLEGDDPPEVAPRGVRTINAMAVPLYAIRNVRGISQGQTVSLATLFDDDVKMFKVAMLTKAKAGEKRPPQRTKEGARFSNLVNIDPEYHAAITKVNPDWLRDTEGGKAAFLAKARAGAVRPHSRTLEGQRLGRWLRTDPQFKAAIAKDRPDWFRDDGTEVFKAGMLARAKAGEAKPKAFHNVEGQRLNRLLGDDPQFKAKIAKANPDWVRDTAAARAKEKAMWLKKAKAGEARPTRPDILRKKILNWLARDLQFEARIAKANPGWLLGKDGGPVSLPKPS